MKRTIKADTTAYSQAELERLTKLFVDFVDGEFYKYEVTGSGLLPNLTLEVTCRDKRPQFMPSVSIELDEVSDGVFELLPTMTFPDLHQSDLYYYDDMVHWTTEWVDVAYSVAMLNKMRFDMSDYDDEYFEEIQWPR